MSNERSSPSLALLLAGLNNTLLFRQLLPRKRGVVDVFIRNAAYCRMPTGTSRAG